MKLGSSGKAADDLIGSFGPAGILFDEIRDLIRKRLEG
jgi:hypothetical protein